MNQEIRQKVGVHFAPIFSQVYRLGDFPNRCPVQKINPKKCLIADRGKVRSINLGLGPGDLTQSCTHQNDDFKGYFLGSFELEIPQLTWKSLEALGSMCTEVATNKLEVNRVEDFGRIYRRQVC